MLSCPNCCSSSGAAVEGSAWDYAWLQWADGPADVGVRLLARAQPGDSGSPVLRLSDGAVIGILRGRTFPDGTGRSETAWAVPIEAAHALLDRLHPAGPAREAQPKGTPAQPNRSGSGRSAATLP